MGVKMNSIGNPDEVAKRKSSFLFPAGNRVPIVQPVT